MEDSTDGVQIIFQRMVRPSASTLDGVQRLSKPETVHLTPLDFRLITVNCIQKGLLLSKPQLGEEQHYVDHLVSSFAGALGRFYPLAGRLIASEIGGDVAAGSSPSLTISLCCNDKGAEFIHAVAPTVTVADIAAPLYIPRIVWSFFQLNGMLGTDAAADSRPLLAVQVTELVDGVFIAMSFNHSVADGTTFWQFFNTWSAISRSTIHGGTECNISIPPPVTGERLFTDSCPLPIFLPFSKLEHIVPRYECPPVNECFFPFSAESIKKLKDRANAEMAGTATTTISSPSVVARARLAVGVASQGTHAGTGDVMLSCNIMPRASDRYNADLHGQHCGSFVAKSTVGEILGKGIGWAAWLVNRAVASFDEAAIRSSLASWCKEPKFCSMAELAADPASIGLASSPRFNVYGNDFGWGRPLAARSGAGNKANRQVTVYGGADGPGSMAMEVCLSPEVLEKLVADEEFMESVTVS